MIIKVARYYKDEEQSEIFEKEYSFNGDVSYHSKIILDDLVQNEGAVLLHDIRTKKALKLVEFTKNSNPDEVLNTTFSRELFKTNREILHYLIENEDLEFIHSIQTVYSIE